MWKNRQTANSRPIRV